MSKTSIVFFSQNDRFYIATDANTVQAYTFPGGSPDGILARFTAPANHICINQMGTTLVAGSRYGHLLYSFTWSIEKCNKNKYSTTQKCF